MGKNFLHMIRTMSLSIAVVALATLFLPVLIFTDQIPIFQQALDLFFQNDPS